MKYYLTKAYTYNIWRSEDCKSFEYYVDDENQWASWLGWMNKCDKIIYPWTAMGERKKELTKNELFLELL